MPSKTQIFKKEQTRMKYYEELFSKFLQHAKTHAEIRQSLLGLVYKLLLLEAYPIKLCTHEKLDLNGSRYDSMIASSTTDSKFDTSHLQTEEPEDDNNELENDYEVFLGYMEDSNAKETSRFG